MLFAGIVFGSALRLDGIGISMGHIRMNAGIIVWDAFLAQPQAESRWPQAGTSSGSESAFLAWG
jgi:hypothetical protein